MTTRIILLAAFSALFLAGCTHMDAKHGSRVRQNVQVQTVNPAASATDRQINATLDGQKAEALLQRYRKEKPEVDKERLIKDMVED